MNTTETMNAEQLAEIAAWTAEVMEDIRTDPRTDAEYEADLARDFPELV